MRMRRAALGVAILVALAASTAALRLTGYGQPSTTTVASASRVSTNLVTVVQRTLTSQLAVSGTLGYAGNYVVLNEAQGRYTALPAPGQLINDGDVIYQVDALPVILLYGSTPTYRTLSEYLRGADVAQLNAALVALGYVSRSNLDPSSNYFDWWTLNGVEKLQQHLGVSQTGSLALGTVVFLPTGIRITSVQPVLGSPAGPGATLAAATSTGRRVVVNLDASQQSSIKVGDQVTINLPNSKTTPGTVASVGTVATTPSGQGGGTPTIEVDITPTDQAATGTLDAAPVSVLITTASAPNVLAVPVTALLGTADGGYELEVVTSTGRHQMIPVTVGLFDDADGLVQVSGAGLQAGQQVVVAGT
jgi:hypothetical protein